MLDAAFSEDLEHDTLTGDLARAIVRVAASLQKSVVFTNIATQDQLSMASDMGASFVQGPLINHSAAAAVPRSRAVHLSIASKGLHSTSANPKLESLRPYS